MSHGNVERNDGAVASERVAKNERNVFGITQPDRKVRNLVVIELVQFELKNREAGFVAELQGYELVELLA